MSRDLQLLAILSRGHFAAMPQIRFQNNDD